MTPVLEFGDVVSIATKVLSEFRGAAVSLYQPAEQGAVHGTKTARLILAPLRHLDLK
ncbi:F420-0:gamma-glutamyl ligase [Rhodococcus fascians]|uniref:hypothetical protein n=1 Tax=Nocardiaceae TaxID=85025 RepID=UPI00285E74F6|nr:MULTISPECIES: hypothetical protein [Rhodococcus]MDR6910111.1 F420-0:gamma-glutamyl ligase [Rhodococcus sp. 3258]MDR6931243.1 F420-0:gamma-glutamyl ligase [Rhodococcus fascians]